MKRRPLAWLAVLLIAHAAGAESCDQIGHKAGDEGRVQADFCREWLQLHPCREQLSRPCATFTFGHLADIGQTLALGQPLHIALGSLAPQNGFAAGLAFVEHKDFENEWRLTSDTDAVATPNGSWRAGSYLTTYRQPEENIGVVMGTPTGKQATPTAEVAPVFNFYAQATSLNLLYFYGLGPNSSPAGQSAFGLTEIIAGAGAIVPVNRDGISFTLEFNGRVPQLRGNFDQSVPSIGQIYTEATAPGLTHPTSFLQPGAGIQVQPSFGRLRLHYLANLQDFVSLSSTPYSFLRWTTDIGHEFALARKVSLTAANPDNGPDSCAANAGASCPHISSTINNEGSISLRLLLTGSAARAGNAVPIYFDPTTGGSNIDGDPILPSYPDYRFRAPNLVLLRGTVEHAIPKVPLGAYFAVDAAKSPLTRSDIDFSNLRRSYSVGLTVHAGGLPVVYLLFAWGGNEGTHTTLRMSNILLGASPRPSLF